MKWDTCGVIILNLSIAINAQLHFVEFPEVTSQDVQLRDCYKRLAATLHGEAHLIIHSNQRDIADYINDDQSPKVLLNIQEDITDIKSSVWNYDTIIIIAESLEEIGQALRKLHRTPSWKPRGKYLVIYREPEEDTTDKLFELSWKYYIVNIIVLLSNNANIHMYFPYRDGGCGMNITAEILGNCYDISLQEMYPPKIPEVYSGCEIRVSSSSTPVFVIDKYSTSDDARIVGFELAMINIIFQKVNLTKLELPDVPLPENSTGTVFDIIHDRYEIAYGQIAVMEKHFDDFDISHVYNQDNMKWIVPKSQLGPQWKSIIIIFQDTLWYSIFGILVVNILIWWLVSKVLNDGMTFSECVLGCWVVLLNGAPTFPRPAAMRFLIVSWTMVCLLLITTYQSKLLAHLLKPIYEPQIAKDQDILDYNLDIPVPMHIVTYLNHTNSETLRKIASRATVVSYSEYMYLWKFPNKYDALAHYEQSMIYYFANYYTDENGKYTMYIFKDSVITRAYFGAYFRKGHSLLNRFNELVDRILDTGLMTKWMTDAYNITKYATVDSAVDIPLNINQLACAFYLLGFGLVISYLIFIAEITFYKYYQKNKLYI